jgi:predicted nucleotidyltransferase component of viral defense system
VPLRYAREDRDTHENTYTFYIGYDGPLPGDSTGKEVKTDITVREILIFPIEERPLLRGYAEYEDVPEDAIIKVYSLDEIAIEKVVALLDRARNEPRDLYDLWYLCEHRHHVDLSDLTTPISQKLAFRKKTLESVRGQLTEKRANLRATWDRRLRGQMATLPEFDEVFRGVRRVFRRAGLG